MLPMSRLIFIFRPSFCTLVGTLGTVRHKAQKAEIPI